MTRDLLPCSAAAIRTLYDPRPASPSTAQQIRTLLKSDDEKAIRDALGLIQNKQTQWSQAVRNLKSGGGRPFKTPIESIANLLCLKWFQHREGAYAKRRDKAITLLEVMGKGTGAPPSAFAVHEASEAPESMPIERAGVPISVKGGREIDVFDVDVKGSRAPAGSHEKLLWKRYKELDDKFVDFHMDHILENYLGMTDPLNTECSRLFDEREHAFNELKQHAIAEGYDVLPQKNIYTPWVKPSMRI